MQSGKTAEPVENVQSDESARHAVNFGLDNVVTFLISVLSDAE